MAERKRRHEMKTLFDNLRNQIPSYQGAKSSKWEILTKGKRYLNHTFDNSSLPIPVIFFRGKGT